MAYNEKTKKNSTQLFPEEAELGDPLQVYKYKIKDISKALFPYAGNLDYIFELCESQIHIITPWYFLFNLIQ